MLSRKPMSHPHSVFVLGLLIASTASSVQANNATANQGQCQHCELPSITLEGPKVMSLASISLTTTVGASFPPVYSAYDDASWGVVSGNISNHLLNSGRKAFYEDFMAECISQDESCEQENDFRMTQNRLQPQSVINYTDTGFKKIRAPEPLFSLLKEFWELNKDRAVVEFNEATAFHNTWRVPTTILMVNDDQYIGGGSNLSAAIWNTARDILEEWTGQKLSGSSVYGIRVYHNQSILLPHVDRLPLISSCIINVDQDVDEDWYLEVYGHDGKATNVTMKPGDMVLYESHSVIHGRPFPLQGKYYANIFVHFQPMGEVESMEELPEKSSLPPYLLPGSPWEEYHLEEYPEYDLLTDVHGLIDRGELYTIRYLVQREPGILRQVSAAEKCGFVATAIEMNHMDILEFLLDEMDYDVNMLCGPFSPLDVARSSLGEVHPVSKYLVQKGAASYHNLGDPVELAVLDERCLLITKAIQEYDGATLDFLLDYMDYDANLVCTNQKTPMDIALSFFKNRSDEYNIIGLLEDVGSLPHLELIQKTVYAVFNKTKEEEAYDGEEEEEEEEYDDDDYEEIILASPAANDAGTPNGNLD